MANWERDIQKEQVKNLSGSYARFEDIEGIGPATANRIKNVDYGISAPSDVADYSAEELADEAGISVTRARKAIRGGGGEPGYSNRSTSGSVSAAGIKMPFGDFKVEASDQSKAEGKFDTSMSMGIGRSQEAAQADKGKRAPITTNYDEWKANKGRLDFPGVDTPTDSPKYQEQDRRFIAPDDLIPDVRDDVFDS